uniref:PDZ domain-containing protein n=1 Tax=Steinernema glaseri TaxID=37863 RepID=A0A1I7Z349_9BILA
MALALKVQLAHGSPLRRVADFGNVAELYARIAEAFALEPDDILFATVNTHKPDVHALLSGTIHEEDIVFVHLAGESYEVELQKTAEYIGVTITDNLNGNVIVKQINANTAAKKAVPSIGVGDVIVTANGTTIRGLRHREASAKLRSFPVGSTVKLKLIRPYAEGFSFISPRIRKHYSKSLFTGSPPPPAPSKPNGTTIRFGLDDGTVIRCSSLDNRFCRPSTVIRLNAALDSYFGFHDDDLAVLLWCLSTEAANFADFSHVVATNPETRSFGLPEDILKKMWMVLKTP